MSHTHKRMLRKAVTHPSPITAGAAAGELAGDLAEESSAPDGGWGGRLLDQVKDRPMACLLVAVGAGLALGALISNRR
jgi:hypothetical protein